MGGPDVLHLSRRRPLERRAAGRRVRVEIGEYRLAAALAAEPDNLVPILTLSQSGRGDTGRGGQQTEIVQPTLKRSPRRWPFRLRKTFYRNPLVNRVGSRSS